MPFINGIATEEDIKPYLYIFNRQQIDDLVFVPQTEDTNRFLNGLFIDYNDPNFKADKPVKRWVNLPFSYDSTINFNSESVYRNLSFPVLFQRYNQQNLPFANDYSQKLFDFLYQWTKFNNSLNRIIINNQFSYFVVTEGKQQVIDYNFNANNTLGNGVSWDFFETSINLPPNNLSLAVSYFVPEYRNEIFPDWQESLGIYLGVLIDENLKVIFRRINNECLESPQARRFKLLFDTTKINQQTIAIREDILIASLKVTFFDDLENNIFWTESEKNFVLEQIPSHYKHSYLDSFFEYLTDSLINLGNIQNKNLTHLYPIDGETNYSFSIDFKQAPARISDAKRGIKPQRNTEGNFSRNYSFFEVDERRYTQLLIFANNNQWSNSYGFSSLTDKFANVQIKYLLKEGKATFELIKGTTLGRKTTPLDILSLQNQFRETGLLVNRGSQNNPDWIEFLEDNNDSNQYKTYEYKITADINYPYNLSVDAFYNQSFFYINAYEQSYSNGSYFLRSVVVYEIKRSYDLVQKKDIDIEFKVLENYLYNSYSLTPNNPDFVEVYEIDFKTNWSRDLSSSFVDSIDYSAQNRAIDFFIIKFEECEMPCDCESIERKLDLLIAALDANKFAVLADNPQVQRVANLGYYIERIARILGISVNEDGSIRSIRQSQRILKSGSIPPGWNIGQWGRNQGGSSTGQTGGELTEDRDGIAYEIRSNTFGVDQNTGEPNAIEEGGYALVENLPQLLEIILDDLDRAIGWQDAGANAIPSIDGSKVATYQGLNRMILDILYNQSALSRTSTGAHISSLKNQAMLQETLAAFGFPGTVKQIEAQIGKDLSAVIPVAGIAKGSPTVNDLLSAVLLNLSLLVGTKFKGVPTEQTSSETTEEATN